jgi:hypothetical protein
MRRLILLVALCLLPASLAAQRVCSGGTGDFHTEGIAALVRGR